MKARITDSINLLTGKHGPLWARRYDAEPVLDDEGCADRDACDVQHNVHDAEVAVHPVGETHHGVTVTSDEDGLHFSAMPRELGHARWVSESRARKPASPTKRKGTRGVALGEDAARAMVLTGAANVFAKLGVRAPTVQDLLTAAGVSRRTFYRLYEGKEDVLLALYQHGTSGLLRACRRAVDADPNLLAQLEGCIDAHIHNARDHGRLMFVLGGEAQRHESALFARRMHVHDAIVDMLCPAAESRAGGALDPLLLRAIILALESTTRVALTEGDEGRRVTDAALERVRAVALRIATASVAGGGEGVSPLPTGA